MPAISVFTPTHDPKFLEECRRSLLAQTFSDWEWVILLNGDIKDRVSYADTRIRVASTEAEASVGALKAAAVAMCRGELLVELDHDDILVSTALERLWMNYRAQPKVSLHYSNCAQINEDGSANYDTFNLAHGWSYQPETVDDRPVLRIGALHPTPHNVSYIWYAPNHVRAFPRWAYDQAGGYDRELTVCDDQDLMCRLYQVGPFNKLPDLLYLQRVHPGNTQLERNALIQTETVRLYDKYVEANALAWAKRGDLACLDLGGGFNSPPGYTSVDLGAGVDIQADVLSYLPSVPENSVGVIRAVDFLEHIRDQRELMALIHRALHPNGMLLSCTPSTDGRGAFQDPTHVSFWNENSFWYWTRAETAAYIRNDRVRFQVSRLVTFMPSPWHEEHNIPYVQANLIPLKDDSVFRDGGLVDW